MVDDESGHLINNDLNNNCILVQKCGTSHTIIANQLHKLGEKTKCVQTTPHALNVVQKIDEKQTVIFLCKSTAVVDGVVSSPAMRSEFSMTKKKKNR